MYNVLLDAPHLVLFSTMARPPRFTSYDTSNKVKIYHCDIDAVQCLAQGCSRTVRFGRPYCQTHWTQYYGLKIKKSSQPFPEKHNIKGVYAATRFDKDQILCALDGERLNKGDAKKRYADVDKAPYILRIASGQYVDCACQRFLGSMIVLVQEPEQANVDVVYNEDHDKCYIRAVKAIEPGTELLRCQPNRYQARYVDMYYTPAEVPSKITRKRGGSRVRKS